MKKIYLIVTIISAVLFLENCRKDTVTATATSTNPYFADINDSVWNPTTIRAAINFTTNTNNKEFSIIGNNGSKQIFISATVATNSNTAGFPLAIYNVNTAGTVVMSYSILTNGIYQPQGTVNNGSGTLDITAIDSVKKTITGTFSFTTLQTNYDGSGNIVSSQINEITQGAFNNLAYTFTSGSN